MFFLDVLLCQALKSYKRHSYSHRQFKSHIINMNGTYKRKFCCSQLTNWLILILLFVNYVCTYIFSFSYKTMIRPCGGHEWDYTSISIVCCAIHSQINFTFSSFIINLFTWLIVTRYESFPNRPKTCLFTWSNYELYLESV